MEINPITGFIIGATLLIFIFCAFMMWLSCILRDDMRNGNVEGFTHLDNTDDN